MIKVLVVIDNIIQYDRIKSIVNLKDRKDVSFIFRHSVIKSAIWEHEDFINSTNSVINVKEELIFILNNFDLVISVHCFQLFPEELVKNLRCINIHPGYNPDNRGWYPQVFAIINDLSIGATIHEMDEKLDNGHIICRKFVDKYIWDTSLSVYNRVLEAEMELLESNFNNIIDNVYQAVPPESKGNIFYKKDFNDLCLLKLDQEGTFLDFYNHLRALSHGSYKNAYFIDKESGKKVFIKLEIEHE